MSTVTELTRQEVAERAEGTRPPVRPGPALRVAHIHSSLGLYGADRWTLTLVKHHDTRRVNALMVTLGDRSGADELSKFAALNNVEAHHINGQGRVSLGMILRLRRLLTSHRIDVVHTHGFKSDVITYLAAVRLPLKLVSTVHGWCARESARIRFYEAVGRMFLRRFDRVYPVSPAQEHELIKDHGFNPSRVRLVLNAVDTAAFDACFERRRRRAVGDPFRILFAGRLSKAKGVFDLVEAVGLAKITPRPSLDIAGDGPEREALASASVRAGIAADVRFHGHVPDVRALFEAADVLVLPSYSEGIPRIVMEACSAGVPVIGSDIPGIRELITDGETGLLVPVADPQSLARGLERTAQQPGKACEMALKARRRVDDKFAAARQSREFEAEYEQLVTTSARPAQRRGE